MGGQFLGANCYIEMVGGGGVLVLGGCEHSYLVVNCAS